MRQLLDVMDQTEEFPLRTDLLLTPEREAVQSLVVPDIPKHRFDRRKASPVECSAFRAVDRSFHDVGVTDLCWVGFASEEADLPDFGLLRGAQAFLSLITRHAVAHGAGEFSGKIAVVNAV